MSMRWMASGAPLYSKQPDTTRVMRSSNCYSSMVLSLTSQTRMATHLFISLRCVEPKMSLNSL